MPGNFYLESEIISQEGVKCLINEKKASISVKECEDSSEYSTGEKHQKGKELYAERQCTWGSAGCKYSRDGARNRRGQEHCALFCMLHPAKNYVSSFKENRIQVPSDFTVLMFWLSLNIRGKHALLKYYFHCNLIIKSLGLSKGYHLNILSL